ncbi:hypothetical protein pipiens_002619 [Culex pipiens pipiens]|uniref:Uncharacterized protein n=1 Tax=Culex pipiens pipiens TaxID=38569 RepID=A0ABD1DB93_CULPP
MVDSTSSCSGLITGKEDAANNYARGHYASARNSETAELGRKLVVDGGWGSWGPWTDCKCPGHPKQGQKRTRVCNNPLPLNSGAPCVGHNTETTPDCLPCTAGRWSPWSEWSDCASDCTQTRHRSCIGGPGIPSASSSTSAVAALVANSSSSAIGAAEKYDINCVGKSPPVGQVHWRGVQLQCAR